MANPFFHAQYYLAQNADVANAVGTDVELAEQHYFLHGAGEGRNPAPWFDAEFYRSNNSDLADVPAEQLFLHFTLHGVFEGRVPMEGAEFDADAYLAENEDLVEGLGIVDAANLTDDEAGLLAQHFYAHGYKEGREGGPDVPEWSEDVDRTELAEALQALNAANEALANFLEENDYADVQAVRDSVNAAEQLLIADYANGTDTALANEVTAAQAGIVNAQTTLANTSQTTDFQIAVRTLRSEQAALERMEASLETQEEAAREQFVAFQKANKDLDFRLDETAADAADRGLWLVTERATDGTVVTETRLAIYVQDPVLDGGQVALTAAGKEGNYKGINDLLNSVNSALSLSMEVESQRADRDKARNELDAFDGTADDAALDAFNALLLAEARLETAEAAVTNRADLVKAVEDAKADVAALDGLEDNIESAQDALEDLGYENVVVLDANAVTSGEGDIFLFNEVAAKIVGFGEEADDVLFFDVNKYTYNAEGAAAGDNNVLEVFLEQSGDDVLVHFENSAYSSAAENDFTTVTLVGVELESVQVDDLGFIAV